VAQLFGRRHLQVPDYQDQTGQVFFHEKLKIWLDGTPKPV
jgi:hypothetical protein